MEHSAVLSSPYASPRCISYFIEDEAYVSLLAGPPESSNMRSGFVVLAPGESVGEHTTGDAEELVIPLSGEGELQIPGLEPLRIQCGYVFYNPPHTPHDVVNTGNKALKYIYVVADTVNTGTIEK